MMRTPGIFALVILALAMAACATTGTGTQRADRNRITQADIQHAGASFRSAYDVVQYFEPQWLRKRSGSLIFNEADETMEGDIVVYVDHTRMGGPEALRTINPETVAEIEYLDAARAVRLGTGHQHGAIMVQTR